MSELGLCKQGYPRPLKIPTCNHWRMHMQRLAVYDYAAYCATTYGMRIRYKLRKKYCMKLQQFRETEWWGLIVWETTPQILTTQSSDRTDTALAHRSTHEPLKPHQLDRIVASDAPLLITQALNSMPDVLESDRLDRNGCQRHWSGMVYLASYIGFSTGIIESSWCGTKHQRH